MTNEKFVVDYIEFLNSCIQTKNVKIYIDLCNKFLKKEVEFKDIEFLFGSER